MATNFQVYVYVLRLTVSCLKHDTDINLPVLNIN